MSSAAGGGPLLRSVELFDIYQGSHIPAGKKSVAFSLEMRADDRTLMDADADAEVSAVLKALEEQLGATLPLSPAKCNTNVTVPRPFASLQAARFVIE